MPASRYAGRALARLLPLCLLLAACASNPDPDVVADAPVRVAPPLQPVAYGDCVEARRRVAEKADAYVDRLPSPKALVPNPLPVKSMPASVRKAKYIQVSVAVMVDTLGRADMSTFSVSKSTHPWLAASVKGAVAKWKFEPARLAGCLVARQFKWGATAGVAPRG